MGIDVAIVAVVSVAAIALHAGLFLLFRRWMDRDLALSFAGDDPAKRAWMLARLAEAKRAGVGRRDLQACLARAASAYGAGAGQASA